MPKGIGVGRGILGEDAEFFAMAGDAAWGAGGLYFSSWDAGDGSYES